MHNLCKLWAGELFPVFLKGTQGWSDTFAIESFPYIHDMYMYTCVYDTCTHAYWYIHKLNTVLQIRYKDDVLRNTHLVWMSLVATISLHVHVSVSAMMATPCSIGSSTVGCWREEGGREEGREGGRKEGGREGREGGRREEREGGGREIVRRLYVHTHVQHTLYIHIHVHVQILYMCTCTCTPPFCVL